MQYTHDLSVLLYFKYTIVSCSIYLYNSGLCGMDITPKVVYAFGHFFAQKQ